MRRGAARAAVLGAWLALSFLLAACNCGGHNDHARFDEGANLDDDDGDDDDADDDAAGDDDEAGALYTVSALAWGEERNPLWIGTHAGLVAVDLGSGDLRLYTTADSGLANNEVAAVAVDADDHVWVGYGWADCPENDLAYCGLSEFAPESGQWTTYLTTSSGLMDNRVFSLALAADGAVWAGTYFGASIKQGDAWSFYDGFHTCANPGDHCGPLWSYQIADLAPLSDGAMWMAVDLWIIGVYPKPGGVARRNAAGLTDTWDMSSGLPSNDAQAVAASDTAVYAGNGEGLALYRADLNEFQIIAQVGVYCLAFGPGGALWVGGPDGARAYTAGDWTHWTIGDGLPADSVRALAASEQMICFGTNAGVGCYAEIGGEWTYPWVPPGDAAR